MHCKSYQIFVLYFSLFTYSFKYARRRNFPILTSGSRGDVCAVALYQHRVRLPAQLDSFPKYDILYSDRPRSEVSRATILGKKHGVKFHKKLVICW